LHRKCIMHEAMKGDLPSYLSMISRMMIGQM
jgi:hypothetical protein